MGRARPHGKQTYDRVGDLRYPRRETFSGDRAVILLICSVIVLVGSITIMIRNDYVLAFRHKLIKQISAAAKADIEAGRDWEWRYEIYETVSYDQMVYKFWKPLESFYQDRSFIELPK
jgi:hypothetical protein